MECKSQFCGSCDKSAHGMQALAKHVRAPLNVIFVCVSPRALIDVQRTISIEDDTDFVVDLTGVAYVSHVHIHGV